MKEKTYVIVEKVFGNFRKYCRETFHLLEGLKVRDMAIKSGTKSLTIEKKIKIIDDYLTITIEEDHIEIRYAIKSEDSINNIIESGLAMSQLVHVIYGTGFGDYNTEIYLINQSQAHLVGKVPARGTLSGSGRKPLLLDPFECIHLLQRILLVQLKHKSFQRDAIITALSQIRLSGHVNIMLAWSWWVFEWTLQHLEKKKPTYQRLKFMVQNQIGKKAHARKFFKEALDKLIKDYRQSIITNSRTHDMFHKDMDVIQDKMKSYVLDLSIMEIFDSHKDSLKNIVSDNLKDIDDSATLQMLQSIFADWDEIRKMVNAAKDARNKGFHYGRYGGLLSGNLIEKVTNLRKFSAFVLSLLTFVLTKHPLEFDSEYRTDATDWTVIRIPEYTHSQLDIPTDDMGLMIWFEWNGSEVVKKQSKIQSYEIDEQMDNILNLKPSVTFTLGGDSSCIIQTRSVMDALHTIKTDNIEAKVEPIFQQDFSFIYKIRRIIIEKSD